MDSFCVWFYSEFMDAETGKPVPQLQGEISLKQVPAKQR